MKEYKQYFYLIVIKSVNSGVVKMTPEKITTQIRDAIKYGRKLATVLMRDPKNEGTLYEIRLYRQLIARSGLMEFIDVLKPFEEDSPESKKSNNNVYLVHWRSDLTTTLIEGETKAIALNKAGYGGGAIFAMDYIEHLKEEDYIETPNHELFLLKNMKVRSIMVPRKFNDVSSMWLTGIDFKDEPSQIKFYKTKELCMSDYEFLVTKFKQGLLNK